MNLTALLRVQQERSGEQLNNISLIAAGVLIHVVEEYFMKMAPILVLTLSCRGSETCIYYNHLLGLLFHVWETSPVQIVTIPKDRTLYIPGPRKCNLILVNSYEAFVAIDVISYTATSNSNEYYYIFLQMHEHLLHAEMLRVFDYCWRHQIINCNVQVQTAKGEILVYTYFPFTPRGCGQVTMKLINEFKNETFVNRVLFPKKLLNFYGCPLRAAIWDVPPFVSLQQFSNNSARLTKGIEAHLIFELAQKLNFTIEIKVPPNGEKRGVVKGKNLTGALLMLHQRTADFSLGCFRLALDRATVTTPTFSYYQGTQIICVPLAPYAFSSLEMLLFPYAFSTWLLFLCIMCFICFVLFSLLNRYYRRFPQLFPGYTPVHSYLNVFLTALGMPATTMPVRLFARLFCTDWMIFTLLFRTVYQALLFHLIRTQPTNRLPLTFDELVKHNYTLTMNVATYGALEAVPFIKELNLYINVNDSAETVALEYAQKYANKHLAVAGPKDFLQYYTNTFTNGRIFHTLPQSVISLPLTMYVTKHSYLIDQFNTDLLTLCSMGLIQLWASWELDYKYSKNQKLASYKIFRLYELHMLFVIVSVGLVLASLVFLLEILSKRLTRLQRLFSRE